MKRTSSYFLLKGKLEFIDKFPKMRPALDSILLGNLLPKNFKGSVLEVGCGMGIPAILTAERCLDAKILGIDIQEKLLEVAKKNVEINKFEDRINFQKISIENIKKDSDAVITNPPFHQGTSPNLVKDIAHHERIELRDWVRLCLKRVRNNGFFGIVIPTARLQDVLIPFDEVNMGNIKINLAPETKKRITITAKKGSKIPLEFS